MKKTTEQPKSQNQAVKPVISSTLVSAAATEDKSLARSLNQKQFKRLTKAELADKRSNDLCFRCDKKFTHRHRCASPALQVLLVDKDNKDDGVADMAKVSIKSLAGWTNNHIMRLRGILGEEEIVMLIDCGSSYNLISAKLVERLGIMVLDTAPFGTSIANGETVYNQGICEGVIISFPELQVVEDFLHFEMGNARFFDVILGIKWLKTLGDVMVNWMLHTMTFGSKTGKITLKGDPDLCGIRTPAKPMANNSKTDKDQISKEIKQHSKLAQEGMKKHEKKSQSDIELKVDDSVRDRQHTMAQGRNKKLAPKFYGHGQIIKKLTHKFYGHYQIINRVGKAGYALRLPKAPSGLILYKQKIKEAFGLLIKKGSTLYKRKLKEALEH